MSQPNVKVLKVEPFHPVMGVLMHPLQQRILDYAKIHSPEMDPVEVVKSYVVPVYAGAPNVLILALIDEKAAIVGHVVAVLAADNVRRWVTVVQYRADGAVGDAGLEALEMVEAWGRSMGSSGTALTTRYEADKWEKRGFKTVRHVYYKEQGVTT